MLLTPFANSPTLVAFSVSFVAAPYNPAMSAPLAIDYTPAVTELLRSPIFDVSIVGYKLLAK